MMQNDDEKTFLESLIETSENISLILILLSIAGLFGLYIWLSYNPQLLAPAPSAGMKNEKTQDQDGPLP